MSTDDFAYDSDKVWRHLDGIGSELKDAAIEACAKEDYLLQVQRAIDKLTDLLAEVEQLDDVPDFGQLYCDHRLRD